MLTWFVSSRVTLEFHITACFQACYNKASKLFNYLGPSGERRALVALCLYLDDSNYNFASVAGVRNQDPPKFNFWEVRWYCYRNLSLERGGFPIVWREEGGGKGPPSVAASPRNFAWGRVLCNISRRFLLWEPCLSDFFLKIPPLLQMSCTEKSIHLFNWSSNWGRWPSNLHGVWDSPMLICAPLVNLPYLHPMRRNFASIQSQWVEKQKFAVWRFAVPLCL